jgi:hypothetical protein
LLLLNPLSFAASLFIRKRVWCCWVYSTLVSNREQYMCCYFTMWWITNIGFRLIVWVVERQ